MIFYVTGKGYGKNISIFINNLLHDCKTEKSIYISCRFIKSLAHRIRSAASQAASNGDFPF